MKLHDYLRSKGSTQAKFAQIVTGIVRTRYGLDVSVTQQAISKVCTKDFLPSRKEIVCAIYLATDGQVTPNDFYDLPAIGQPEVALEQPQEAAA